MLNLLFLILLIILTYLIGLRVLISFKFEFNILSERILISTVLGLGIISLLMFFLGIFGLYYKSVIISLFIVSLIILLLIYGKREYLYLKSKVKLSFSNQDYLIWIISSIFAIYVIFNLLRCMTPVINADSLAAYLIVPKLYIENHSIYNIEWVHLWGHLPLNVQMLSGLGILLHSDILSQLINGWLTGLLSAFAIYVLARNFVNRKIAFISAVIFYTMPALSWLIYSTKIDLGYTVFELAFWVLFVKWIKVKDRRVLYISAIFLGFAIGSKYHSLIALTFATITALAILFINKKKFKYILFTLLIFVLIALAIGSPSYIKNYIYTQDPVYPFITNPNTGSHEEINQYHGVLDYFRFQYNMIFEKDYILVSKPMMDKPIGFLPILFLPFLFFVKKRNKKNRISLIVMVGYYFFLSFIIYKSVFPYPRHFLPAIGLLTVINSVGIKKAFTLINRKIMYLVLILSIFSLVFIYHIGWGPTRFSRLKLQINYISGQISKTEYLKQTIYKKFFHMNYDMVQYVKTMPEDTRIMTLDYGIGYYVPRPFVKKLYTYSIRDLDSLLSEFKKDKITHIYFNKPTMENYVNRWYDGKYSIIIEKLEDDRLIFEKKAWEQYLYRINYDISK